MSIQHIRRSVLVVALLAALAAGGMIAGRLAAGVMPEGPSADRFAPHMFRHMARVLDLTDDQKSKIKAVLRTHATEIEAQMTAGATARGALRDTIIAQPVDEASIRAKAAELGRVQGDGAVLFAKIRTEVDPILTAEQKDKLQSLHARLGQHGARARQAFERFLNEAAD